jgi:hypothetical protein
MDFVIEDRYKGSSLNSDESGNVGIIKLIKNDIGTKKEEHKMAVSGIWGGLKCHTLFQVRFDQIVQCLE